MGIISCIGSGNMGFALMSTAKGADIYITDADLEKAKTSALSLGAKLLSTNTEAVEKGDIIFLAVKPQALQQV